MSQLLGHGSPVSALAPLPSGLLVVSTADGCVRGIWADRYRPATVAPGTIVHFLATGSITILPDNRFAATGTAADWLEYRHPSMLEGFDIVYTGTELAFLLRDPDPFARNANRRPAPSDPRPA